MNRFLAISGSVNLLLILLVTFIVSQIDGFQGEGDSWIVAGLFALFLGLLNLFLGLAFKKANSKANISKAMLKCVPFLLLSGVLFFIYGVKRMHLGFH